MGAWQGEIKGRENPNLKPRRKRRTRRATEKSIGLGSSSFSTTKYHHSHWPLTGIQMSYWIPEKTLGDDGFSLMSHFGKIF
jgi:hypothetical protein